jgi:uncharacterized protein DUF5753
MMSIPLPCSASGSAPERLGSSAATASKNDGSEVLYTEGPGLSHLIDDPDRIAESALRFDLIMGEALTSAESLKMIRRALEGFS